MITETTAFFTLSTASLVEVVFLYAVLTVVEWTCLLSVLEVEEWVVCNIKKVPRSPPSKPTTKMRAMFPIFFSKLDEDFIFSS